MTKIKNFTRLNDYYFKKLMGIEEHKPLLLDFLNTTVFVDRKNKIVDLSLDNTEVPPNLINGKLSRLDIKATAEDGRILDIEIQVARENYMPERSVFYLSRLYGEQLTSGDDYPSLKQAIGVNLLNFSLPQLKTLPSWHNYACFCVPDTAVILSKCMELHFLELDKLKFSDVKKIKKSEIWGAYFSGKCSDKDLEVLSMENPLLKKALDYENYFNGNEALRKGYIAREEAILDEKLRAGHNFTLGKKEGIQIGIQQANIQNAINFLRLGIDVEKVAEGTNLSIEKVKELQQSI